MSINVQMLAERQFMLSRFRASLYMLGNDRPIVSVYTCTMRIKEFVYWSYDETVYTAKCDNLPYTLGSEC